MSLISIEAKNLNLSKEIGLSKFMNIRTIIIFSSLFLFNQYASAHELKMFFVDEKEGTVGISVAGFSKRTTAELNDALYRVAEKCSEHRFTLVSLDLSDNDLVALPKALKQFPLLKILNCSKNAFTEIPGTVEDLCWVEELDFSDNNITSLKDFRTLMPALRSINVVGNPLEYISSGLALRRKLTIKQK